MVALAALVADVVVAHRVIHAGGTLADAEEASGLDKSTISRAVDKAGGMAPRRLLDHEKSRCLCLCERVEIQAALSRKEPFAEIGAALGRHRSSIDREVGRNGGPRRYRAVRAQRRADKTAQRPKNPWLETYPKAWLWVQGRLRRKWSPEQISARLNRGLTEEDLNDGESVEEGVTVSAETIYHSIYVQARGQLRKELAACLRSGRAKRRPRARAAAHKSRAKIAGMVKISERPPDVEDRAVPGHWEGDLIVGKNNQSAVATLVERKTRFLMLIKVDSKAADHVAERLVAKIVELPEALKRTLTWDQGAELAGHARIAFATGIDIYFCDPKSPWQRGSNENTNGLIRQYLPKGTNLSNHSQTDLDHIADELNGRPRQTLDWMKPSEALNQTLVATTA